MNQTRPDRERFVMGDASAHVGFLNCERIADRSHIHDWTVETHFHEGLSQLFVFGRGGIEARIDYEPMALREPAVVWLPALYSHAFNYPEDIQGWVITVPASDVARIAGGLAWLNGFVAEPRVLREPVAPDCVRECLTIAGRIEKEHARHEEDRNTVLESLFILLLVSLKRGLNSAQAMPAAASDRRQGLMSRFVVLLDRHLMEARSVTEYADMLSVTPTHLSRSVKSVSGRTAAEIIHDRILLEAKRQLVFTDKSIAAIAYELKFSTPSYFSRFFVRQMEETPRAFRTRMRSGPSPVPAVDRGPVF